MNKVKALIKHIRSMDKEQWRLVGITACVVVIIASLFFGILSEHYQKVYRLVPQTFSGVMQERSVYRIEANAAEQKVRVRSTVRYGQRSRFDYYAPASISVNKDTREATAGFGNPSLGNDCNLVFHVVRSDGTIVFSTMGMAPGTYLSTLRIQQSLPEWKNECRLVVVAYDAQTNKRIGTQYSNITVYVGDYENE